MQIDHERMIRELLESMQDRIAGREPDSPLAELARDFFANNWAMFQETLLCKTTILRVVPEPCPAPRMFQFELDRPYKCKRSAATNVELMPGPIRGAISYRTDLFQHTEGIHVAVQIDPSLGYFHPNCARRRGSLICLGHLPPSPFPLPLDLLIENHIYPILTYQNMTPSDPLDRDASIYFAFESDAMEGLTPVPPLY